MKIFIIWEESRCSKGGKKDALKSDVNDAVLVWAGVRCVWCTKRRSGSLSLVFGVR